MTAETQIEDYLAALRLHLGPLTIAEREEIVREITAHIRDSAEESGTSVESVLARLGPPEELAKQYRDGLLIRRASHSFSPVLPLRGTLRLATKGISGVFVFFFAVFGYAFGAGLVLVAFAKTIVPSHAGAWVEDGRLVCAGAFVNGAPPQAHEILGMWIIPIGLTLGVIAFLMTSFLIRKSLVLSQRVQARL